MGRRRRSRQEDNPISLVLEMTDAIWQVGAVAGALLGILGTICLHWIFQLRAGAAESLVLVGLNETVGPLLFALPTLLFLIAVAFFARAFDAYQHQR